MRAASPDVVATACANVALVKYWGKRSGKLNLPYTGSISVTLDGLATTASITRLANGQSDTIEAAGVDLSHRPELTSFIGVAREAAPNPTAVHISLQSNFPVAAGLASSASTFAALTSGLAETFGLNLSPRALTVFARCGSGSAARSLSGGFVEWFAGEQSDGGDSYAEQICPPADCPLGIVVAVTDRGPKRVSSRDGMQHVVATSPFFPAWLASHEADLQAIRIAILSRNLCELGAVAEHNCLKMHAISMAARPALIYWNPATVAVIERVRQMRESGVDAFVTIDAGPQVKVLCRLEQRDVVADEIARVPGVEDILLSQPGPGVRVEKR